MVDRWIQDDFMNPEPVVLEESELIAREFLSPTKLREISGKNDLKEVEEIEITVNTTETTLGNFGQYLPCLKQLKLNDSVIPCIRDIGTAFKCVTVLWMSRSALRDVDGIASMQSLQELYIAYNNIDDISPISFLDELEVLDIEANQVSSVDQIDYLSIMTCLTTLTITGNPVVQKFSSDANQTFRDYVLGKIPNLQHLDDEDIFSEEEADKIPASSSSHSQEDMDIVTKAIKDGVDIESKTDSLVFKTIDSNTQNSFDSMVSDVLPSSFSLQPLRRFNVARPSTAAPSERHQKPFESNTTAPLNRTRHGSLDPTDASSSLTFGDPLCGNPMHALKQRKSTLSPVVPSVIDNLVSHKSSMRPSTSTGLRKPLRVTVEDRAKSFDYNLPKNLTANHTPIVHQMEERKQKLCNGVGSKPHDDFGSDDNTKETVLMRTRKVFHAGQSPSPPMKVSPSPPFKSPTPPRSPQRPQSARDFRHRQFRRSISSTSQSINVMTVHSVSNQLTSDDSLRSPIEDPTT